MERFILVSLILGVVVFIAFILLMVKHALERDEDDL